MQRKQKKKKNRQPTNLGKQIEGQQSKAKEDKKLFNFLSLHHTTHITPSLQICPPLRRHDQGKQGHAAVQTVAHLKG